jgi:ADP-ribose pyrophosphatase
LLGRREVYLGRRVDLWLEHVRLPTGAEAELEVVRHTGASAVVPLTETGDVYLIRQYRHAAGGWLLEIPAGVLEAGPEDPEDCARRELTEETGFRAGRIEALGWIWTTPGFTDEKIWLYLATGLEAGEQALEFDEVMSVERMPLTRAIEMVHTGAIRDAKTICGLLRAAHHLGF